jgi:hypothetical protein
MSSTMKKIKRTMRKTPKAPRSEVALAALLRGGAGTHKHKNDRRARDARRSPLREEW